MFVLCKNTPKGIEPVYDENNTPLLFTLSQAIQYRINNKDNGRVFQDVKDVFDVEEIEINPLKG